MEIKGECIYLFIFIAYIKIKSHVCFSLPIVVRAAPLSELCPLLFLFTGGASPSPSHSRPPSPPSQTPPPLSLSLFHLVYPPPLPIPSECVLWSVFARLDGLEYSLYFVLFSNPSSVIIIIIIIILFMGGRTGLEGFSITMHWDDVLCLTHKILRNLWLQWISLHSGLILMSWSMNLLR